MGLLVLDPLFLGRSMYLNGDMRLEPPFYPELGTPFLKWLDPPLRSYSHDSPLVGQLISPTANCWIHGVSSEN